MSVLLLADSQVERVWPNVRNNREAYRTAIFIPVKNFDQMLSGFQGITATVSFKFLLNYKRLAFVNERFFKQPGVWLLS